jgi:acyl dehydratase
VTGLVRRPARTVAVGEVIPERTIGRVSQTDVVRFAGAGGDFNPLHHDPQFARAAGYDGPIAMGQFQAGLLAAWVTDAFGVENLRELAVRFTAPLRLGDVLTLSGSVVSIDAGGDAHLEFVARVGDVDVVRGAAVVRVIPA